MGKYSLGRSFRAFSVKDADVVAAAYSTDSQYPDATLELLRYPGLKFFVSEEQTEKTRYINLRNERKANDDSSRRMTTKRLNARKEDVTNSGGMISEEEVGDSECSSHGESDQGGINCCFSTSFSSSSFSSSCTSAENYSEMEESAKEEEKQEEEKGDVLVVAGCKHCLMYFMLPKMADECPKCNNSLLLHFHGSENDFL